VQFVGTALRIPKKKNKKHQTEQGSKAATEARVARDSRERQCWEYALRVIQPLMGSSASLPSGVRASKKRLDSSL
jgi:hypothetical protein